MHNKANKKMNDTTRKQHKGFTLVELIVVIGILVTLSVLAVVAYSSWQKEAQRAALSADANAVCRTLNMYNSIVPSGKIKKSIGTTASDSIAAINAAGILLLPISKDDVPYLSEDKDFSITLDANRAKLITETTGLLVYNESTTTWSVDTSKIAVAIP